MIIVTYSSINFKKSASDKIFTPKFSAFSSLDPVLLPVIRKSVFLLIEFVDFPPYFSTIFFASEREIVFKAPVKTKILF